MCKKLLYSFTYYFLCRLKLLPQKYSLENCMKLPCVVLYTQPRLDSMLLILVYYVTYQSRYAVIEIYLPLFSPLFLFLCLICSALLLLSAFLFFLCLLPLSSLLSLAFFFSYVTKIPNLSPQMKQFCSGMKTGLPSIYFDKFISSLRLALGKERYKTNTPSHSILHLLFPMQNLH